MGYTKTVKVELKDALDQSSRHYVTNITGQWQDVVIPWSAFEGIANARKKELVIVFEDMTATARQGVIYFDDIRFIGTAPTATN